MLLESLHLLLAQLGIFKVKSLRSLEHTVAVVLYHLPASALEHGDDFLDVGGIFLTGYGADAAAPASADVELEAWPEFPAEYGVGGDLEIAGPQGIELGKELDEVASVDDVAVRAEIPRTVVDHASGEEDLGILVCGDAYPGIGLGILQEYVVPWLVLLDEIVLKQQRVRLGGNHAVLGVGNLRDQDAGLAVKSLRRDKILRNPLVEVLGLAHIYHIPLGVIIPVDSGGMREQCYLFPDGQDRLFYVLCNSLGYVLTAEVPLEYGAVRTEEDDVRNALDAVDVGRDLLRVDHMVPRNGICLRGIDGCLRLVPYGHAEDVELVAVELFVNLLEVRNLSLARAAPAGPEIDEHILALAYIVRELLELALFGLHLEIGEHLALGGGCIGLGTLHERLHEALRLKLRGETCDHVKQLFRIIFIVDVLESNQGYGVGAVLCDYIL